MSLKTGFTQIFSGSPKNLRCPKFEGGGAAAPLAPRPVCISVSSFTGVNCLSHPIFYGRQKVSRGMRRC